MARAYVEQGNDVEGQHLILFTSVDQPRSEWTHRILIPELPPVPVSVAVAIAVLMGLRWLWRRRTDLI